MDEAEILALITQLKPKMQRVLHQTSFEYREDLEQELKEKIIKIIQSKISYNTPSFFDLSNE
ncbi:MULTISPECIES: hypothetical protein [Psychrobacillus]|uniref:Helix-turn-helix conjugative transposon-like domain-containing protein n=1 Tax=Psychrobacillus faecigallinarum TaxID=2762235 RepID=A0ABR8R9T2_9BACI|nr:MULTISPECIES: hypothetical protein [Psychrobacillus]MBD7944397.1 hypothetical protein [Psychrobacillus faecigallinarum]QEY19688.1 hypothetical protein D0S48_02700 [Psychrobacillus sp. AK 1817]QGM30225.1 hypothetical protein GI482_07475 [Bacillus sp. N3536]